MSDLTAAIQDLPQLSWIPILVLLVIGLAMWFAGARLLRAAFGGLGLLVGGAAGWLVGNAIDVGVPCWAVALVGGLLLACLATLAYKPAVAGGLALVLAVGAPLAVWSLGGQQVPDAAPADDSSVIEDYGDGDDDDFVGPPFVMSEDDQEMSEEQQIKQLLEEAAKRILGGPGDDDTADDDEDADDAPPSGDEDDKRVFGIPDGFEKPLEDARTFAESLAASAREMWDQIPPHLRDRMIGAAVVGGLIGFLFGTLATSLSASLVTACAGSMAWLIGAWAGLTKVGIPKESWIPSTPNAWLLLWIAISVIGLAIQWITRPKRADKGR